MSEKTLAELLREDVQKLDERGKNIFGGDDEQQYSFSPTGLLARFGSASAQGKEDYKKLLLYLYNGYTKYLSGSGDKPTVDSLTRYMTGNINMNMQNTAEIFKSIDVDLYKFMDDEEKQNQKDKNRQFGRENLKRAAADHDKEETQKQRQQSRTDRLGRLQSKANAKQTPTPNASQSPPAAAAESYVQEAPYKLNVPTGDAGQNTEQFEKPLSKQDLAKFFDAASKYIIKHNLLNGGKGYSGGGSGNGKSEKLNGQVDRGRMNTVGKAVGLNAQWITKLDQSIYDATQNLDPNKPEDQEKIKELFGKLDRTSLEHLARVGFAYLSANGKSK